MIDKDEIQQLTREYGGDWGLNHSKRLLDLVSRISGDYEYNAEVIWLCAYLHDWGGYAKWKLPGIDHAQRSGEVVEEFLSNRGYPQDKLFEVLECITTHHSAGINRSIEAQLLSDADALDFLGCIGILRIFSKRTKDLRAAYENAKLKREQLPGKLCLEESQAIAVQRLDRMDQMLAWLEQETQDNF